jgi:hypothetical protein
MIPIVLRGTPEGLPLPRDLTCHNGLMRLVPWLFLVFPMVAQSLRVYSEFVQFDDSGAVSAPLKPREILSPVVARNGFTSLQISVRVAPKQGYFLYVRQNPEEAFHVTVYREESDGVKPAILPFHGAGPQIFWLDLWADRGAPLNRVKVEPQIRVGDDWFVYPMEARVINSTFPDGPWREGSNAPGAILQAYLCGGQVDIVPTGGPSVPRLRFRNVQQDLALAPQSSEDSLRELMGGCKASLPEDPEWYLHFRDYLFRSH